MDPTSGQAGTIYAPVAGNRVTMLKDGSETYAAHSASASTRPYASRDTAEELGDIAELAVERAAPRELGCHGGVTSRRKNNFAIYTE
jgi:hypothetical protein